MTSIRNTLYVYYISGLRIRVVSRNPAAAIYHAIMYKSPKNISRPDFEIKIFSSAVVAEAEYESLKYHNLPVAVATATAFGNTYYVYEFEADEALCDGHIFEVREPQPVGAMHFRAFLAALESETANADAACKLLGADIGGLTYDQCHEAIFALKGRMNQDRFDVLPMFIMYMNEELLDSRICSGERPTGCLFQYYATYYEKPNGRDTGCVRCCCGLD